MIGWIFPALLLMISCGMDNPVPQNTIRVKDALGRDVNVPEKTEKIMTMRAGALRLVCYMQAAEKVAYIELNELSRSVPYMMANPEFRKLPVLGVGNNIDPELLAASEADVIVVTYMDAAEADALEKKTGKPVFALQYGDLIQYKNEFYGSLKALGRLFKNAERAEEIIRYIEENIVQLEGLQEGGGKKITAYLGGVAFNGSHGLASSRMLYPPFVFSGINNPVDALQSIAAGIGAGQKNIEIDPEQIIAWNPDFIFLDASGINILKNELQQPWIAELNAWKNNRVYTLLPFNWNTINYENLMANAWFVAAMVNPHNHSTLNIESKAREAYTFFLGRDVYDEMKALYQPFEAPKNLSP